MDHSTISDAGILSGLTELWHGLALSNTQVSDVSPLSTLTQSEKTTASRMPGH